MIRISQLVVLGDSLTDRGTFNKRHLLGILSLGNLSGLNDNSPKGRFTNGYLWGDYICAATAERFEIQHQRMRLKQEHSASSNADLGDEFLTSSILKQHQKTYFSLNNDKHVLYKKRRFARFYCEGGLTSRDYSHELSLELSIETYRLIVSTLEKKREELLTDDTKYHISAIEKAETLVIEWSGANDLMTVNTEPTYQAAEDALNERLKNLELLIQNGYRNFVLFNLPNLALTPRFQAKDKNCQDNASDCCTYFNEQLAARCDELNKKYMNLNIPLNLSVFNVQGLFDKIYHNPEQYGFDKDKINKSYIESDVFKKNKQNSIFVSNQISPAKGYMFWDDVHPSMTMHNRLAVQFQKKYGQIYNFQAPQLAQLKRTKDDIGIGYKPSTFFDRKPIFTSTLELPENIKEILNIMGQKAVQMCKSDSQNYQEKGKLLKKFIFDLKSQNGDLEKISQVISSFNTKTKNIEILETHYRPVYDFLAWKNKTFSEDLLSNLANVVKNHLAPPSI